MDQVGPGTGAEVHAEVVRARLEQRLEGLARGRSPRLPSAPTDGGVAERLNAAVLKTARSKGLRGSNPLASAIALLRTQSQVQACPRSCMHSSPVGPPWDPSCPTARSRTESRCDLRCLTKHGAKRAARGVHGPETGSGVGEAGRAVTAWSACTPWHLQFWYRYSNLDATSNTANGVSIRFCP